MRRSKNSRLTNCFRNKPNHKTLSRRSLSTIYTNGEVFADGSTIDLVQAPEDSSLRLHFSAGAETRISEVLELGRSVFHPAESNVRAQLVRFPRNSAPFGSIDKLFAETRELFAHFGFSPEVAFAAAIFCCATWFIDVLPIAPRLVITGPTLEAALLLDLISCIARRSLPIGEFTRCGLTALPLNMEPTLLIAAEVLSERSIALFRTSNRRRAYVSVNGCLADVFCAKAIHCAQITDAADIDPDALPIELLPSISRLEILDQDKREKIASQFQPQFLAYRCRHILDVLHSPFDAPDLAPPKRMLARVLGAAVEGAPELQSELTSLLRRDEERNYENHLTDLRYVVADALLAHVHCEYGQRLSVASITKTVNGILLGRGDATKRNPREIGATLKSLGVRKKRRHDGYSFELDDSFSEHVHQVAHGMGIFGSQKASPNCAQCQKIHRSFTVRGENEVANEPQ